MKTYYHILGLNSFASLEMIRKAYRRLALKHHPDRGGDEQRMKEINEAYEYLMKNKETYDEQLKPRKPVLRRQGFTIVVNGFGYGFQSSATTATGTTCTF